MVGQVVHSARTPGQEDQLGQNPVYALFTNHLSNLQKGRLWPSGNTGNNKRPEELRSESDCLKLIYRDRNQKSGCL